VDKKVPGIEEVSRSIGRLEGQVEGLDDSLKKINTDMIAAHTLLLNMVHNLENKVEGLNIFRWKVVGALAVIVGLIEVLHMITTR
jgi:hypothetical protein